MELMTLESLARAIHEDQVAAVRTISQTEPMLSVVERKQTPSFDDLPEHYKAIRREQARLMLERIMR